MSTIALASADENELKNLISQANEGGVRFTVTLSRDELHALLGRLKMAESDAAAANQQQLASLKAWAEGVILKDREARADQVQRTVNEWAARYKATVDSAARAWLEQYTKSGASIFPPVTVIVEHPKVARQLTVVTRDGIGQVAGSETTIEYDLERAEMPVGGA